MAPAIHTLAKPLVVVAAVVVEGDDRWDARRVISHEADRWSREDQPTGYVAGDPGVALAEAGRHLVPGDPIRVTSLWQIRVSVDRALDTRERRVAEAAGVPDDPAWILDRAACREVADRVRRAGIQVLVVPSAAFIDLPERFNLVLFPECADEGLDRAIGGSRRLAVLEPRGRDDATG
jgi:hypothetical protein